MVVKTHTKNKSDISYFVYDIKDSEESRILSGALRHEWNATYFKGYKRKLNPKTNKKELTCPKHLLDSTERKNIRKTIQHLINNGKYYHYFKSSKKHKNSVPIFPYVPKQVKILNGVLYYPMKIRKGKNAIYSETIIYKLKLENTIPDGVYEKAGISLSDGKLKLIIDLKSKKEDIKKTKRNVSVKLAKELTIQIKRLNEEKNLNRLVPTKILDFDKRRAKRKIEKVKKSFFEVFWKIWKNASKMNFECIKEFNKETGSKYENQVLLPHTVEISNNVAIKILDDLNYYYKTNATLFMYILTYYNNILLGVNGKTQLK